MRRVGTVLGIAAFGVAPLIGGCGGGAKSGGAQGVVRSAGHYTGTITRRALPGSTAAPPPITIDVTVADDAEGTTTGTAISPNPYLPPNTVGTVEGKIRTDFIQDKTGKYIPHSSFHINFLLNPASSGSKLYDGAFYVGPLTASNGRTVQGVVISGDFAQGQSVETQIAQGWPDTYDVLLVPLP